MSFLPPPRRRPREQAPVATAVLPERLYRRLLELLAPPAAAEVLQRLPSSVDSGDPLPHLLLELARLQHLADQLLQGILPRIVRRLSFHSRGRRQRERLPARGRIDWPRTLTDQLQHAGTAGQTVITQARRREFTTADNLVSAAIVLDVRRRTATLLQSGLLPPAAALRHPLQQLLAGCDRLLGGTFAEMRAAAELLLDSGRLPEQVNELTRRRQINRAYHDLADWYRRLNRLTLSRNDQSRTGRSLQIGGERLEHDYRNWLTAELLLTLAETPGSLTIRRSDDGQQLIVSRPDGRQMAGRPLNDSSGALFEWQRLQPAPHEIRHDAALVWREPPLHWYAVWRADSRTLRHARSAVDGMSLRTVLLCAAELADDGRSADDGLLELVPPPGDSARIIPRLQALLARTFELLEPLPAPDCHGLLLDGDDQLPPLLDRFGTPIALDDAVLCRKPHLGPHQVELVSRSRHCCRAGAICQIIGRPDAVVPTRRPRSEPELLRELAQLRLRQPAGDPEPDSDEAAVIDTAVSELSRQVTELTHRYIELSGNSNRLEQYEQQLLDIGLQPIFGRLSDRDRQSLSTALFLRDQLDRAAGGDYSSVVLHLTRVVENLLDPRLRALKLRAPHLFSLRHRVGIGNFSAFAREPARRHDFLDALGAAWRPLADAGEAASQIEQVILRVERIRPIRNAAAHTTAVNRDQLRQVLHDICGSGDGRIGLLHLLLQGWTHDN
jgi:hypothetical protein